MNRILTCCFPILFLLVSTASCKKPTIVTGTVTDRKTGTPIEGAEIEFQFKQKKNDSADIYVFETVVTDIMGRFTYENDAEIGMFAALKSGYVQKGYGTLVAAINQCEANDVSISLIPLDGRLNLIIENSTGQFDSIYVKIYSPSVYSEATITKGSVNLHRDTPAIESGEVQTFNVWIASEEYAHIYWGFSPITNLTLAPFHDSIYITKNDTTHYLLSI